MQVLDELSAITAKLDQEGIEYALCDGLAMVIYALPRATLDIDLMIEMDSLFRVRHAMQEQGFTLPAAPTEFHAGKIQIFRLSKIDRDSGEELVLYLSEEAVTKRLRQVEELRRACLSLADSSAGRDIQNRFKASQLVQRTSHALGR